jgi:hypothetical protein
VIVAVAVAAVAAVAVAVALFLKVHELAHGTLDFLEIPSAGFRRRLKEIISALIVVYEGKIEGFRCQETKLDELLPALGGDTAIIGDIQEGLQHENIYYTPP